MTRARCASIDPSGESPEPCSRPVGHPGRHAYHRPGGGSHLWGERAAGGDPKCRVRRSIELTLSPEALRELARRAGPGGSRSAVIEQWLIASPRR